MTDQIPVLGISIWPVVKIMFLVALGVYVLFASVVIRQVQLMIKTLEVGFEVPILVLSIIHFVVALGVFFLAVVVLG